MAGEISPDSPKYAYSGYDINSDTNISDDEASKSQAFRSKDEMAEKALSTVESLFDVAKQGLNTAQLKVFNEKRDTVFNNLKTRATNYASGALSQFIVMDSTAATQEIAKTQADTNIKAKCDAYQELANKFMTEIAPEAIEKAKKEAESIKEEKPAEPPVKNPPAAEEVEEPETEEVEEKPTAPQVEEKPVAEETEWTDEKKAEYKGALKVCFNTQRWTWKDTASVKTPDGTIHTAESKCNFTENGAKEDLIRKLKPMVYNAGWINATFEEY